MLKKWKRISSEQVFSHPRHNVFIDQVELPNGRQTEYIHFGKMIDAVMVIAQRDDGKILLQKEYSYPPNEFLYQFPGGLLEKDEEYETGANRELQEEAGIEGDLIYLGWMYLENRRKDQKMHFYFAQNLQMSKLTADAEEVFEDYWYSEAEIEALIRSNDICNYTALAGWAFYRAHKK